MEDYFDEDFDDDFDDDVCEVCGSSLLDGDGGNCPFCRGCGGEYAAGSEECDFCPDEAECSAAWLARFRNF